MAFIQPTPTTIEARILELIDQLKGLGVPETNIVLRHFRERTGLTPAGQCSPKSIGQDRSTMQDGASAPPPSSD